MFAVFDNTTPYLEFYQKRQMAINIYSDGPVSKHSLQNCRHVSSVITPNGSHFEFTITLDTHSIRYEFSIDIFYFCLYAPYDIINITIGFLI